MATQRQNEGKTKEHPDGPRRKPKTARNRLSCTILHQAEASKGPSWAMPEPSRALLGRCWSSIEAILAHRGPICPVFGLSWNVDFHRSFVGTFLGILLPHISEIPMKRKQELNETGEIDIGPGRSFSVHVSDGFHVCFFDYYAPRQHD